MIPAPNQTCPPVGRHCCAASVPPSIRPDQTNLSLCVSQRSPCLGVYLAASPQLRQVTVGDAIENWCAPAAPLKLTDSTASPASDFRPHDWVLTPKEPQTPQRKTKNIHAQSNQLYHRLELYR